METTLHRQAVREIRQCQYSGSIRNGIIWVEDDQQHHYAYTCYRMSSSPPTTTTTIEVATATTLFCDPQVMSKTTLSRVTADIEREDVDIPGTTEEHPAKSDEPQCEPIEERFDHITVEEHPAEAEEPQLQQRLSLVTMEDWDGIHNTCMEQAGCTLPTVVFTKDATPVNEDSLSPEKRESANSIMTA